MKDYKFLDPDNDKYEIIIPREVVKQIIVEYLQKTYYWTIMISFFMIGFLFGKLV